MFTLSCHRRSTAARPVALSRTVYTTIGCRSSRIFPLAGQRCCTCASDVTAVTAASASLRRTPWYYRSTSRLVAEIITAFRETVSASKIGTQFNVSGATAMRYLKCVSFKPTRLPEVLSIKDSENISKNPGIYSRRGHGSA